MAFPDTSQGISLSKHVREYMFRLSKANRKPTQIRKLRAPQEGRRALKGAGWGKKDQSRTNVRKGKSPTTTGRFYLGKSGEEEKKKL